MTDGFRECSGDHGLRGLANELGHGPIGGQWPLQGVHRDNEASHILEGKLAHRQIEAKFVDPTERDRASWQDHFTVPIWMNPTGPLVVSRNC